MRLSEKFGTQSTSVRIRLGENLTMPEYFAYT
jgi:hypothetical protein